MTEDKLTYTVDAQWPTGSCGNFARVVDARDEAIAIASPLRAAGWIVFIAISGHVEGWDFGSAYRQWNG